MFKIGDYFFDSDRLIFIKSDLSADEVSIVKSNTNTRDLSGSEMFYNQNTFENLNAKKAVPTSGVICLTDGCQLNCTYCQNKFTNRKVYSLTLKQVEVFVCYLIRNIKIKQMSGKEPDLLSVTFTGGGEPTFDWDLFVKSVTLINENCSKHKVEYVLALTTNGVLRSEQLKFIATNFKKVMVSYDGIPSVHNNNRGMVDGYYDVAVQAENTIRVLGSAQVEVSLRSVVWQNDFNKLKEMSKYIYTNFPFIVEWSITHAMNLGKGAHNTEKDFYDAQNYNFTKEYITTLEYVKNTYDNKNINALMFNHEIIEIFCGSFLLMTPILMTDGTVTSCADAGNILPVAGKVTDTKVTLYESYTDEFMKTSKTMFFECKKCMAYAFCAGGCPAKYIRDKETSIDTAKWECEMIIHYWKYIFQQLLNQKTCFGFKLEVVPLETIPVGAVYQIVKE